MCNPRRVVVQLRRAVEEAWRTTVEQTARLQGTVEEVGRLTADLHLDEEMGDLALGMLDRLVRGEFPDFEAWQPGPDGTYRRDLGDVALVYHPGDRRLTVEAVLAEAVSAEARATAEACGFTVGEVAVEAAGRYFTDNWGGQTEERARRAANEEAQRRLDEAVERLHRQQNAEALAEAEARARGRAEEEARAELERCRAAVRLALRERLEAVLAGAEERMQEEVNRLVGEAYRQGLILLVRENGGRVLTDERTGSIINLEVELF
jgi:hypothetical protein